MERKKKPKPRINDGVEMLDMSKTFGVVKKIVNNTKVLVDWGGVKEEVMIEDLALVARIY